MAQSLERGLGQVNEGQSFRRFMRRGLQAVEARITNASLASLPLGQQLVHPKDS